MTYLARMTYTAPDAVNTGPTVRYGVHQRHIDHETREAALETCHRWRRWAEQAPADVSEITIDVEQRDPHGRIQRTTRVWPPTFDQTPSRVQVAAHLAAARARLAEAQR